MVATDWAATRRNDAWLFLLFCAAVLLLFWVLAFGLRSDAHRDRPSSPAPPRR